MAPLLSKAIQDVPFLIYANWTGTQNYKDKLTRTHVIPLNKEKSRKSGHADTTGLQICIECPRGSGFSCGDKVGTHILLRGKCKLRS